MFCHCAWRHNSIPVQCLQIWFPSNLLIYHHIIGGLGAGGGNVSPPHIQFQSNQRLEKN